MNQSSDQCTRADVFVGKHIFEGKDLKRRISVKPTSRHFHAR